MKPSEIAKIAADIAEQLNKLKPDEAAKVLEVVDTLRDKPKSEIEKTALPPWIPDFTPPSEPPTRNPFRDMPWPRPQLIS